MINFDGNCYDTRNLTRTKCDNSEFVICHVVRHGIQKMVTVEEFDSKCLYCDQSNNGTLLYSSATK